MDILNSTDCLSNYRKDSYRLSNNPRTFQRLMDIALSELQGSICSVYLHDVVIYAKDLKVHEQKFDMIMNRLRQANDAINR